MYRSFLLTTKIRSSSSTDLQSIRSLRDILSAPLSSPNLEVGPGAKKRFHSTYNVPHTYNIRYSIYNILKYGIRLRTMYKIHGYCVVIKTIRASSLFRSPTLLPRVPVQLFIPARIDQAGDIGYSVIFDANS